MTRTADNQAWAILARHHYAQETAAAMSLVMMGAALSFTLEEYHHILDTAEAA